MNNKIESIVHVSRIGGHHQSFLDLFSVIFGMQASIGKVTINNLNKLIYSNKLLFATLDDDVLGFSIIAILRAIMGKPTAGLFLSPHSCFFPRWKSYLKLILFKFLKFLPKVSTFSLLPFEAAPHLKAVATDFVHDPQLWDLIYTPQNIDQTMVRHVNKIALGRPVLVFLGTVAQEKGIDRLTEILTSDPSLSTKICIIIAGKVNNDCKNQVKICESKGATIWDRRITDNEMAALYVASDLVWACYHPDYDQASGIFGRAVQYSRRPVISDQAKIVGYYSDILDLNEIRLPIDAMSASRMLFESIYNLKSEEISNYDTLNNWKNDFIEQINKAIIKN